MEKTEADLERADLERANFEKAKLVWDEYKYRHELCWKLLFQLIIAVVVVSLVPYAYLPITKRLSYFILVLPFIAVYLTFFSIRRMRTEIALWEKIKEKHVELQNDLKIIDHKDDKTWPFRPFMMSCLRILFLLGTANFIVLLFYWIPLVDKLPEPWPCK